MTSEPSGRLYSAVTKHWPRLATGLVVVLGVIELFAGGLTADSSVEFYLMAWAGTTGGVWFLFEKAETALSSEARDRVVAWVREADVTPAFQSIPAQFALLFDRFFGETHLSWKFLLRSAAVSLLMTLVLTSLMLSMDVEGFVSVVNTLYVPGGPNLSGPTELIGLATTILLAGVILNVAPDYLSLMQTRGVIRWIERNGRLAPALVFDLIATSVISLAWIWYVLGLLAGFPFSPNVFLEIITTQPLAGPASFGPSGAVFFYSAFATSVWLWVYILAVLLSRLLLRMNSGVGFLLRVTDVERQPFRSLGFVSVIIVSVVFALGLPLVLV